MVGWELPVTWCVPKLLRIQIDAVQRVSFLSSPSLQHQLPTSASPLCLPDTHSTEPLKDWNRALPPPISSISRNLSLQKAPQSRTAIPHFPDSPRELNFTTNFSSSKCSPVTQSPAADGRREFDLQQDQLQKNTRPPPQDRDDDVCKIQSGRRGGGLDRSLWFMFNIIFQSFPPSFRGHTSEQLAFSALDLGSRGIGGRHHTTMPPEQLALLLAGLKLQTLSLQVPRAHFSLEASPFKNMFPHLPISTKGKHSDKTSPELPPRRPLFYRTVADSKHRSAPQASTHSSPSPTQQAHFSPPQHLQ